MDAPAPRPDRIGPYRLEGRLGVGGMGEVYRAYDERLGRWVAIKLIRPDVAGHEKARERFRREARAAACLNHRAIVQIHDILQSDAGDAIVMELVEGPTLADRLSSGPLDLDSALRIALPIAEGLAAAHAEGIVHRDLKTENVVITPAGDAKILDFGVAKRFRQTDADAPLSIDGALVGTLKAMSPEQARGWRVDHRSDIFSFGTLLYEMLTGHPPFTGDGAFDILTKICTWEPPPVRELNSEVPEALSNLIDRLMEKDCSRRPQSAEEVVVALGEFAGVPAGNHALTATPTVSDGGPTLIDDPRRAHAPGTLIPRAKPRLWKRLAVRFPMPTLLVMGVLLLAASLLVFLNERRPEPPQSKRPFREQVQRKPSEGQRSEPTQQETRREPQELKLLRDKLWNDHSEETLAALVVREKELGETDAALKDIQEFRSRFLDTPFVRSLLAEIHLGYGNPLTAAVLYSDLFKISPKFIYINNLGTAYLLTEDYYRAEEIFKDACRLFPDEPAAFLSLADTVHFEGRDSDADAQYKKVRELTRQNPRSNPKIWTIRAQALAHLGEDEEAKKTVWRALKLLGARADAEVWYEASLVFTVTRDFKDADRYARMALDKGIAPRWFNFSWFIPLKRQRPNFERYLRERQQSFAR